MPIRPLPLCWRRLVYLWLCDASAQPKRRWPAIPVAMAPRLRNFRGAEGENKKRSQQKASALSVNNNSSNSDLHVGTLLWDDTTDICRQFINSTLCDSEWTESWDAFSTSLYIDPPLLASPPNPGPFSSFSRTVTFLDPGAASATGWLVNGVKGHAALWGCVLCCTWVSRTYCCWQQA